MGITADFVLVVVAGFAGAVAARALGLPLLVGYVAAGVVVGPHTAGPTVADVEDIEVLAEIGVALLLFTLGLELSLRDLHAVRRVALLGGPLQIAVTTAIGAWVAQRLLGVGGREAVWFGAMTALSSSMVVLKTLAAEGTMTTLASRVMIGLLVVQDLAVVPLLIVLPQLGGTGSAAIVRVGYASLLAAAFLVAMVVAGTRLLPALLRRVVRGGSRELFLVAVVAAGVGTGALAFLAGLSFAIGAFVAGIVLSETELRHQALSDVAPLRDLFGLLFFVSVGMLFDPRFIVSHARDVAVIVAIVVVGKAIVCGGVARAFGYRNLAPAIVGLGLSQIGEFSFVIARAGRTGDFIAKETYDLALTCTVLSMALSPLVYPGLVPAARAWARWRRHGAAAAPARSAPAGLENHVVVAGYGRTGRAVADALKEAGVDHVIVDLSHEALAGLTEAGEPVVWGDIGSEDVLRAAGVTHARMLVVAVPAWHVVQLGVERARHLNPRLFVIARAATLVHVEHLRGLGVNAVVQPEFEGGIEIVRRALSECDREDAEIDRITSGLRRALYGPSAEDDPTRLMK